MTDRDRSRFDYGALVAALTAVGLGGFAGAMMVIGNKPWDGRQLWAFNLTNGLHVGDVYAVGPIVVGLALGWWCLHRRRRWVR